jgi:hypothetical protein
LFDPLFPPVQPGGTEVRFSPNPSGSNSLVKIDLEGAGEISRLRVFDSAGRLTREMYPTESGDNTTFYTNDFPTGVYSVHIDIVGLDDILFGKLVVFGE